MEKKTNNEIDKEEKKKDFVNILPEAEHKHFGYTVRPIVNDHLRDVLRVFEKLVGVNKDSPRMPTLLDVGARDSRLVPFFAENGISYTGVDLYPRDQTIHKGDMHDLPFHSESFDTVFCSHTLEHSTNILKALEEMMRVTRCGGTLFIATPLHCTYQIFECDKTHILVPTREQMVRLFQIMGIECLHCGYWNVEGQEERFTNLITVGRVSK